MTFDDQRKANPLEVLKEINITSFLNSWGPAHVLQVYDPATNMHGVLVIDNTTLGPGCGGLKIAQNVTPREVYERARTRTWACALLDVNFGGAASGIRADPVAVDRTQLVKSFARMVSLFVPGLYVAAPDIGTEQAEMGAFAEEVGDRRGVTGKPEEMHGIPYELGVLGFGMGVAIETTINAADSWMDLPLDIGHARVVVHGLGSVGRPVAKYLSHKGARVVAVSEDGWALHNPNGIDVDCIPSQFGGQGLKAVAKQCGDAEVLTSDRVKGIECDILVYAMGHRLLCEEDVGCIKAKCIVEGFNDPITQIASQKLFKRGAMVLPQIISTGGGVISSYAEYSGSTSKRAFSMIEARIREVTGSLVRDAIEHGVPILRLAREAAKERILRSLEEGRGQEELL